jgi:hypothetical protein
VIENLRMAAAREIVPKRSFAAAERRAIELLLEHRLYRSDRTGEVISERLSLLTCPGAGTTRSCAFSTTCV